MPRVIYKGEFGRVKVFFADGSDKKITRGVIVEMTQEDFDNLSKSGNFEIVEELKPEKKEVEKKEAKKIISKKGGK